MKEVREELARIRRNLGRLTHSHPDPTGANLAYLVGEMQRLCLVVDRLAAKIEGRIP